jgi:hypothetical protein
MRFVIIFTFLILSSCGGSLSSEQRKKIRTNMEAKSLKKISDADLTEAAFDYGRAIANAIELNDKSLTNRRFLDSLEKSFGVQIFSMHPTDSFLHGVEKKIIEAYTSGSDLSKIGDDLQKVGLDSLIYTKPLLTERPDGSLEFIQALAIRIPKRQVILSIKE